MDITETIIPKSDQLNAEDMLSGPVIVTVEKVTKGSAEQPVNIHLNEFPARPFKPCKTMRRVLVSAWGADASAYAGRRMTLYRDASVRFGGQDVGGIRISAMSHIAEPITLALTVTRGRRAPYTVEPLADAQSKIPSSFDAKIAGSSAEQCVQAREYLAKYEASEPERVAELLKLVAEREAVLSGGETA